MKILSRNVLCLIIIAIIYNGCNSLYKTPSGVHFATEGYEKNSPEYCVMLVEDYDIYKKLYRNYDDLTFMFQYLDLLDSARLYCDEIEKICYREYDLLMTLGLYQECINRIQDFPDSMFKYPYDKIFMLNSAQSALAQIDNDTIARDQHNSVIINAICDYWNVKYKTEQTIYNGIVNYHNLAKLLYEDDTMRSSGTLLMFYVVRARLGNIEKLQNEISDFTIKNKFDSLFISNLQHCLQQMNEREKYHFERDIIINPPTYHLVPKN